MCKRDRKCRGLFVDLAKANCLRPRWLRKSQLELEDQARVGVREVEEVEDLPHPIPTGVGMDAQPARCHSEVAEALEIGTKRGDEVRAVGRIVLDEWAERPSLEARVGGEVPEFEEDRLALNVLDPGDPFIESIRGEDL